MGYGERGYKTGSAFCLVKYIFIIFNVLVWLFGFGILSVGIWLQVNQGPYSTLLPNNNFLSATALFITAGAIIFVVGFCGCFGAMLESQCMLVVYFIFVLIIFGLEVTATALGLSNKSEIKQFVHQEVTLSIQSDYNPKLTEHQQRGVVAMVDSVQRQLECCGVNNYTDWYSIDAWPDQDKVPMSCCVQQLPDCGEPGSKVPWFTRGCMKEIEYWFITNMYTLGILGLTAGVIQILAMAAAVSMFCCLRSDKYLL